uniref:Uncharacterized protein n=1 Tax=Oryza nivara TaxID=4536 RepID=A0A0E0G8I8_ORYNI
MTTTQPPMQLVSNAPRASSSPLLGPTAAGPWRRPHSSFRQPHSSSSRREYEDEDFDPTAEEYLQEQAEYEDF